MNYRAQCKQLQKVIDSAEVGGVVAVAGPVTVGTIFVRIGSDPKVKTIREVRSDGDAALVRAVGVGISDKTIKVISK